jgi:hypothetical protein
VQICLDGSDNLYVLNSDASYQTSILVFSPGASGSATPVRTLSGTFNSLAVDLAGDIYAMSGSGLSIFAPGASGAATPVQTLTNVSLGPLYTFFNPNEFEIDSAGNIYRMLNGVGAGGTYAGYTGVYRVAPPVNGTSSVLNSYVPPGWAPLSPSAAFFAVR